MEATAIKERPIIMTAESVRAILDGRKTQTRRVLKFQPPSDAYELCTLMSTTDRDEKKHEGKKHWVEMDDDGFTILDATEDFFRVPYQIGERRWVRETWASYGGTKDLYHRAKENIQYRATWDNDTRRPDWHWYSDQPFCDDHWRSPIYMPRWASRLSLEVTDAKVERVQDISIDGAKAEGIEGGGVSWWGGYYSGTAKIMHGNARSAFESLWDTINAKRGYSWESNPWVWAVTFRRVPS